MQDTRNFAYICGFQGFVLAVWGVPLVFSDSCPGSGRTFQGWHGLYQADAYVLQVLLVLIGRTSLAIPYSGGMRSWPPQLGIVRQARSRHRFDSRTDCSRCNWIRPCSNVRTAARLQEGLWMFVFLAGCLRVLPTASAPGFRCLIKLHTVWFEHAPLSMLHLIRHLASHTDLDLDDGFRFEIKAKALSALRVLLVDSPAFQNWLDACA